MSKFSEALQKIEENRSQKKLYSYEENMRKSSRRDKVRTFIGYTVLILGILLAVFSFVYDFGFNKVVHVPERQGTRPATKTEAVAAKFVAPVESSVDPEVPEVNVTGTVSDEKVAVNIPEPVPARTEGENVTAVEKKGPYYTIQLVTYQKKEQAEHEVSTLADQGFRAFVMPIKKYYTVCVEQFNTKVAATKRFAELKKTLKVNTYKDAYIRFVK